MKVYLDNQATTPVDPRVVEAISSTLKEEIGNPASSLHAWGWRTEELTNIAREQVASLIGANPKNIIFTSGATESINMTLLGLRESKIKRILHTTIEHKAVIYASQELERFGFSREQIPVDRDGRVIIESLENALKTPTQLVSVIAANNEIGTIQDMKAISKLCRQYGALLHLDITQLIGKVPFNISDLGADFASFSSHKMYGPKGVGALFGTQDALTQLRPILFGGGQEGGLRSGTLNVPGIVGFGLACKILQEEGELVDRHISGLTALLKEILSRDLEGVSFNGDPVNRIPGNLNVRIPGVDSSRLIGSLALNIALTAASACLSKTSASSLVLEAIGLSLQEQKESFRIGIGRFNTEEEIRWAAQKIVETAKKISPQQSNHCLGTPILG
jgi:cysteine desulfurase